MCGETSDCGESTQDIGFSSQAERVHLKWGVLGVKRNGKRDVGYGNSKS